MSTANKLAKVLETKLNIKQAITEKGVNILDTDTFASYPDKIKAIESGGDSGGEKKFVTNSTTNTYNKGDKVLVNTGVVKQSLSSSFELSSSSPWSDWGSLFTDNNNVFTYFSGVDCKHTFSNNTLSWVKTDTNSWNRPYRSGLILHENGIVNLNSINVVGASRILLTNTTATSVKDNLWFLGGYNDKYYGATYSNGYTDIYDYDILTNTRGSVTLLHSAGEISNGYICSESGNGFISSRVGGITFFNVNEDGVFVEKGSSVLSLRDDALLVTFTGAEVGDYLFFATNYDKKYNADTSGTDAYKSNLIIYKIVEVDGLKSVELVEDIFKDLQVEDCLIQFDLRNNVLTVGTLTGVYAYEFDRSVMQFKELSFNVVLPNNNNKDYCYRLMFSPDKSKAIVTVRPTYNTMKVSLYILGSSKWEITKNDSFSYNSQTSFTGFATGNVDDEGKVEVEMLLPEKVDINIVTNVDVSDDEIIFEGVV